MAAAPRRGFSPPLDDMTIAAVEILTEAVMDARESGGGQFMVVTSALQRVVADRRPGDLSVACAAFDQLDGALRASIAERAVDRAEDQRHANRRAAPPPEPPATERRMTFTGGAPLLAAMSGLLVRKRPL